MNMQLNGPERRFGEYHQHGFEVVESDGSGSLRESFDVVEVSNLSDLSRALLPCGALCSLRLTDEKYDGPG
jgi:hypothetical protein